MNLHELSIYICHCKQLQERRDHLEKELARIGVNQAQWILDFDGVDLPEDYHSTILCPDLWHERMHRPLEVYQPICQTDKLGGSTLHPKILVRRAPIPPPFRILTRPATSLVMKHRWAYRDFIKTHKPYAMVVEDDAIFHDDFCDLFPPYMRQLPPGADLVHIGAASNLFPTNPQPHIYFYKHHLARGTGVYLVSRRAAQLLAQGLQEFAGPIDFEINYFIFKYHLNSYWLHPPLAWQGSETAANGGPAMFASSLEEEEIREDDAHDCRRLPRAASADVVAQPTLQFKQTSDSPGDI